MRIHPVTVRKRSTANGAWNLLLIAVGNVINVETGDWTGKMSGLGAGLDSFYEYLLKV